MNQTTTEGVASIDLAQLDALEALAQAATPGEWTSKRNGVIIAGPMRKYPNGSAQCQIAAFSVTFHSDDADDEPERQQPNADYSAAANPATVQQLIALARRSLTSGAPAEPIYQAQFEGEYGSIVWHDVTEAAYHTFMPQYRRIVRVHDAAAPCDYCKDIREAETIHGDGPDAAAASAEQARNDTLEEVAKMLLNGRFLHDEAPPKLFANEAASAIREMKRAGAAAKSEQSAQSELLTEIQQALDSLANMRMTTHTYVSFSNVLHHCRDAITGKGHYGAAGAGSEQSPAGEVKIGAYGKFIDWNPSGPDLFDLPVGTKIYLSAHQSPASGGNAGKDERALPALPESLGFMDVFRKGGGTKSVDGYTADQMREYARAALSQAGESAAGTSGTFQAHVEPWMAACFGPRISADTSERNHRFFEEATELAQAGGMPKEDALMLVEYVYGRPVGELHQEVGGVMVTLAALCLANKLNMNQAGEVELARIWTKVEAIRSKQATKPKNSPLPQHAEKSAAPNVAGESAGAGEALTQAARDVLAERRRQVEQEGWKPAHDDHHIYRDLAFAAACYAKTGTHATAPVPADWPWDHDWWKPGDERHNLIKSGALILAEVERLDRAAMAATGTDGQGGAT